MRGASPIRPLLAYLGHFRAASLSLLLVTVHAHPRWVILALIVAAFSGFEGGFVEQHVTQLISPQGVVKLKVCVVGTVNVEGKIESLEEYLDPSPFVKPA